jgi:hypothetical protein
MSSSLTIEQGIPYLTLGTLEQLNWVTQGLKGKRIILVHPSMSEIDAIFTLSSPFEEKTKIYIVYPEELRFNSERGLPRYKHLTVSEDNYYFFLCALPSGDIQLTDGYKVHDRAEHAKKLTGKPYKTLDLRKQDYGLPQTTNLSLKKLYEFHKPYPYTLQRKLAGGWGLDPHLDWYTKVQDIDLIESLNRPDGYIKWGNITDAQMYEFFSLNKYNKYCLFHKANVSNLDVYIQPFLQQLDRSPVRLAFKAPLSRFAIWCYCSHHYWADSQNLGLFSYNVKNSIKRAKGIEKAYLFKPSLTARQEWLNTINKSYVKMVKR